MLGLISINRSSIFLGSGLVSFVLQVLHIQVRSDFLRSVASQCLHSTPFFKFWGFMLNRSHNGFDGKFLFKLISLFAKKES